MQIRDLVRRGVTVLLTTQYLEEADRLADVISIIDGGQLIAQGTAQELKSMVGGQVLVLRPSDKAKTTALAEVLRPFGTDAPNTDEETGEVVLSIAGGAAMLPEIMRRIDAAGVILSDMACRHPTLDDVFLSLTGRLAQTSEQ